MIVENLIKGFALGITTGTVCFATCGPIYSPFLMQRQLTLRQSVFTVLEISAGRFVAYILFGILAGMLGKTIQSMGNYRTIFTTIAYVAFSAMLLHSAFQAHNSKKKCAITQARKFGNSPLLLGILTGINFCPSFLIALTDAVNLNGPLSGATLFFGFYMGTNIYLLPLSIFGVLGNKLFFRKVAMVASVVVGAFFIVKAGTLSYKLLSEKPPVAQKKKLLDDPSIVSILGDQQLFLVGNESEDLTSLSEALQAKRKGEVIVTKDGTPIGDKGIVLVSSLFKENPVTEAKKLITPSRFVIVLPELKEEGYSEEYNGKIITFFDKNYFKQDTLKGTFFNMSAVKPKPKQAPAQS